MTDTTEKKEPRKGAAKLVKFFGKKSGQTIAEFKGELDQLTDEDYAQLVGGIEDGSLTY